MKSYVLEKPVWDDTDFDVMGWHDATVWSVFANPEQYQFFLDLDYIFQWVHPSADETYFKFWVSPVTMVFDNVHSVELDIISEQGAIEISCLSPLYLRHINRISLQDRRGIRWQGSVFRTKTY